MDHQPQSYRESLKEGASFQISGHTHKGQLFPFPALILVTEGIFKAKKPYPVSDKDNTQATIKIMN